MRKVLILIALLPGLALADSVGGPSTNQSIQTASPQNGAATLNDLQPAPDASSNSLAAPTSPADALQGSTPDQNTKLEVEADGAPQNLPSGQPSNTVWIVVLTFAAAVLAAASAVVWNYAKGGTLP